MRRFKFFATLALASGRLKKVVQECKGSNYVDAEGDFWMYVLRPGVLGVRITKVIGMTAEEAEKYTPTTDAEIKEGLCRSN